MLPRSRPCSPPGARAEKRGLISRRPHHGAVQRARRHRAGCYTRSLSRGLPNEESKKAAVSSGFTRALCRTRTGDPFVTMEAISRSEPADLQEVSGERVGGNLRNPCE